MLRKSEFRSMGVSSTVLRRVAQASSRSSIPETRLLLSTIAVLSQGDALEKRLSLYAGFPIVRMGSGKQQQQPAEPTLIYQQKLSFRRGFGLGASRNSLLLPQQAFGCSHYRARVEELRESCCLLGLAFPGSMVASWLPLAMPN